MKKSDIEILDKLIREKPECVVRVENGKPVSVNLSFKVEEGGERTYWFHGKVEELKNERFKIPFDGTSFAFKSKNT